MKHKFIVKDISDYLNIVQSCLFDFEKLYPSNKTVFRGQSNSENKLIASLFRTPKESSFEYSQIHFLRASKFVEESDELEIAIRAQHYSYFTRLMDVSYNCLIALFFACLGNENKDGSVYVISVERYLPPTAIELSELYRRIIKNADILKTIKYIKQSPLIIETIKNNDRIIAQSGAFLLFFNDKHRLDEENKVVKILIPQIIKKNILEQLHSLFNIYTGSVFPEIEPNANSFNNNLGNEIYNGINCEDIFKTLLTDNLYNFVKVQANEFNLRIFTDQVLKGLEVEKIIRHFNYLTDFYLRDYSEQERRKTSNELREMFLEMAK